MTTVAVAASFVAAGVVARRIQAGGAMGRLLVAVGLLWAFAKFPLPLAALRGAYALTGGAWAAGLAHLVVAYPTGRLDRFAARAVVGLAYVSVAVVGVMALTVADPLALRGATAATVVCALAVVCLQVHRWRRSSVTRRRAIAPVVAAAVVAATLLVVHKPLVVTGGAPPRLLPVLQVALAAIPLAFLATLVRRRTDRGGIADLLLRFPEVASAPQLRRVLTEVLHDPALRIGYWSPELECHVDAEGRPVILPPGPDRAVTPIDGDDGPLAVLVHDPVLLEDRALVDAAGAAVALVLRNERLTADVRAKARQLAASRDVAVAERRRLERDLHDGVQQRLLAIPMTLALAESALRAGHERAGPLIREAKDTSLAVLDDVRALAHGLHPPVLTERGLAGAVAELAASIPVPVGLELAVPDHVPAETEITAYFVVAEALANVTRHARAARVRVRVTQRSGQLLVEVEDDGCGGARLGGGSGLRGLADRAADRGGSFEVDSPAGGGTRMRVMLPCA